jgi:hypothetical protein
MEKSRKKERATHGEARIMSCPPAERQAKAEIGNAVAVGRGRVVQSIHSSMERRRLFWLVYTVWTHAVVSLSRALPAIFF